MLSVHRAETSKMIWIFILKCKRKVFHWYSLLYGCLILSFEALTNPQLNLRQAENELSSFLLFLQLYRRWRDVNLPHILFFCKLVFCCFFGLPPRWPWVCNHVRFECSLCFGCFVLFLKKPVQWLYVYLLNDILLFYFAQVIRNVKGEMEEM